MRPSGRAPDQMRELRFEPGFTRHAEGSCLVGFGDTRVLVTASIAAKAPGPYHATYAASKAFVHSFAEGIRVELELMNSSVITQICTGTGRPDITADLRGPVPSDLSYTGFADGSRWWADDGRLGLRQSGTWRWL